MKTKCFKTVIVKIAIMMLFFPNLHAEKKFFNEGKILFENKKFDEAKIKFEKDIVFNPKNENSYLYLAKIFNKENMDDLEEQNLNVVILLNPKNEEALYLLTLLRIKKSDYDESQQLLKKFEKVCNKICNKKEELISKLKSLETN